MESKVSEILENILGMLSLEGSFEVVEGPEEVSVSIETSDPGRLIGFKGETLDSLQLIVNMILSKQLSDNKDLEFKRVVIDVAGWRKSKEGDLERRARVWAEEVLEKGQTLELDPMPSWQRRIVHMVIADVPGVVSESLGEGKERHLVLRPGDTLTPTETPAEVSETPSKKKSPAKKKASKKELLITEVSPAEEK